MTSTNDLTQTIKNEVVKRTQFMTFMKNAIECLGYQRLSTFFLLLMQTLMFRDKPMIESAKMAIYDDKIKIEIEAPISKEDLKSFDYFPIASQYLIAYFYDPKIEVKAVDPAIRIIGTAEALLIKKVIPEAQIEVVNDKDIELAKECFPWIKKDVKEILKLIEAKVRRKMCNKKKRCPILEELLNEGGNGAEVQG